MISRYDNTLAALQAEPKAAPASNESAYQRGYMDGMAKGRRDAEAAPQPTPAPPSRDQIREVFMAHGFTIKEGQTDLKQYVYDAAHALLELGAAPQQKPVGEVQHLHELNDSWLNKLPVGTKLYTAPAPLSDDVVKDAARYRWLREGNDAKHGAAWHVAVNLYGCEWDAAIDAALAAQGENT